MLEVELQIPESVNADALVRVVEHVCVANDLKCTLKRTLVSYPGCIHWHFRKARQKGTLEITWWESENRLWFKIGHGRAGAWMADNVPLLKEQIQRSLH